MITILLQVEATTWAEIGKLGPVFLLMGYAIYWLNRKLERSEDKCDKKDDFIQSITEKNIATLKDVQNMLDKVFDNQVNGDANIRAEIMAQGVNIQQNLKEFIKDLIDHIPVKTNDTV